MLPQTNLYLTATGGIDLNGTNQNFNTVSATANTTIALTNGSVTSFSLPSNTTSTLAGNITGAGGLVATGNGNLVLSGVASTFSGGVTMGGGLTTVSNQGLGNSTANFVVPGSVLQASGAAVGGGISIAHGLTATIDTNGGSFTFSGSGSSGDTSTTLNKIGVGTATFTAASPNLHAAINVNGGLLAATAGGIGDGTITLNGGNLQLNGAFQPGLQAQFYGGNTYFANVSGGNALNAGGNPNPNGATMTLTAYNTLMNSLTPGTTVVTTNNGYGSLSFPDNTYGNGPFGGILPAGAPIPTTTTCG